MPNSLYVVEKYWFDPMENHSADGWDIIGIVSGAVEAARISNLKGYKVEDWPWPLRQAVDSNKAYAPAYRCTRYEDLDGKSIKYLESL